MKHIAEIPEQLVIAVIPARYASTRLPGKLLLNIAGKPMVIRTAEQATRSRMVQRVIIAADDERIAKIAADHGFECAMTSAEHQSGTDRVAEVAAKLPERSIVVNVQADEPMIAPETIDRAVEALIQDADADILTTCEPIREPRGVVDPNVVKVVCDATGRALYFSRSPIPFPRVSAARPEELVAALIGNPELLSLFRKHTGLYVYRREFLLKFASEPASATEKIEMLEQLRALEMGASIKVVEAAGISIGVDTAVDLEHVRALFLEAGL